jgi:hypothetical protein
MLKKTLIGLVVLSFVVVSANAATQLVSTGDPVATSQGDYGDAFGLKAYGWEATVEFKPLDLDVKVPVYMDVGLFLQITNRKQLVETGIKLEQKAINRFEGCSIPMEIQTNFDMVLGASVAPTTPDGDALGGTWSAKIMDETCSTESATVIKNLSGDPEKRTIWVELKDAKVFELDFGKKKHVANVTLNVKPKSIEILWTDP